MGKFSLLSLFVLVSLGMIGCTQPAKVSASPHAGPTTPIKQPELSSTIPKIVNPKPDKIVPHNAESFTQGLLYSEGRLYESGGRYKHSSLQRVDTETGEVEEHVSLADQYFAEGLAELDGKLYQLTWQQGLCLVYDKATLKQTGQLFYNGEGWGLTVSPQEKLLILSSGNDVLQFFAPKSLVPRKQIQVTDDQGNGVHQLNELEWVRGEIWANIWMTDRIARINPDTGRVVGWIVLTELCKSNQVDFESVLNGIAYDPKTDILAVTGKLWPKLYIFENVSSTFFEK